MLRGACDPVLLLNIKRQISSLFARYENVSEEEFHRHLTSSDPSERRFWNLLKLSAIYDETFHEFAGYSYIEILERANLLRLLASGFPEVTLSKSKVCMCRRIRDGEMHRTWDRPITFHVDAQFFDDDRLSINFWTPLDSCGVTAPGVKVILLGVEETKAYLGHDTGAYLRSDHDVGNTHHFLRHKMDLAVLEEHQLLDRIWAPEFELGDILAFTNFTMHATHFEESMRLARTSVEVRIDLLSNVNRSLNTTC